jgi:cyanate permease
LLRRSRVLLALVAVELFWGFGMVAFESLTPVRLAEIVGDADQAAAISGSAASAAWLISAAGSATVPWLGRRLGMAPAAAMLRVLQAVAVVGLGWSGGVAGVVTAYLFCYLANGASFPAHMTLLHRQVEGPVRATVVSLNSMMAQPAGAIGAIALTALADGTSVSTAMYAAAAVLALAAPLYIPAWRRDRHPATAAPAAVPAGTR